MSIGLAPLRTGSATQSTAADNATATATVAAVGNQTHLILGVEAHYSAAVSLIRTVVVKKGTSVVVTHRWDFTNGPFMYNYPVALRGDLGGAVSVEVQASGTGGTNGYGVIYTATD